MFKGLFKKVKVGNLLIDRLIRLFFVILSLYLGSNFFTDEDFFKLQQITLFQSILIGAISLPVNSILVRLGNSSLNFFKSLLSSIFLLRFLLGALLIFIFCIYLVYSNVSSLNVLSIGLGILPVFLYSVFLIEILPHVFDFEGKTNWQLIFIYLFFLIVKSLSIIFFKSLHVKIFIELVEVCAVLFWNYKVYLSVALGADFLFYKVERVKKIVLMSSGLYLNGILSVFILRVDQFALINLVDSSVLSSYMLIVSISTLFLIPMSLLSERIFYVMSVAKGKSLKDFMEISVKWIYVFALLSLILYFLFLILFIPIGQFVFDKDLREYMLVGLVLGSTIFSNSVGMVFGQINSILNGGNFTLRRTIFGSVMLFFGVSVGFKTLGILGVAIAAASSLLLTNIVFWFFSSKIRRIILRIS
jgi:hypothetical protein